MNKIYLDHSATTPVDLEVVKAMQPYWIDIFGNASSLHNFGQEAGKANEYSRQILAKFLDCNPNEVYFTSGATEADNIVILGIAQPGQHIITSQIEHPAILEACGQAKKQGAEVTYISVNKEGLVDVSEIKKAIKDNTAMVSIMYVNNEIGTIQPIIEIGKIIAAINKNRKKPVYFHTDAVQAANYCEMSVKKLGVDLLSFSGHKIYGPKGIGVLYVKKGVKISPIQFGGRQENGLRPGTYNTPAIVGLGKAVELINTKTRKLKNAKIKELRDYLAKEVLARIPDSYINGSLKKRVPNNASFCFKGVEGESVLLMLDFEGIAVSTGSACSSDSLKPSYVLTAIGVQPELVHGSLRISLGKNNTLSEIDKVLGILVKTIKKLRNISPL